MRGRGLIIVVALVAACQRATDDAAPPAPAIAAPVEDAHHPTRRPIALSELPTFPRDANDEDDIAKTRYRVEVPDAIRSYFAGMRARSCGVIGADSTEPEAIAAFTCAKTAIAAHEPFAYVHAMHGIDSGGEIGWIGRREGSAYVTYELSYDSNPCGGGCSEWGHTDLQRCTLVLEDSCRPTGEYCYKCEDSQPLDTWIAGTLTWQTDGDAERVVPQLIGAPPASLGTLLGGVQVGGPAAANKAAIDAANIKLAAGGIAHVELGEIMEDGNRDDDAIGIHVDGHCGAFRDRLTAAWGPSPDGSWLDPATGQRARLRLDRCYLWFDRYAPQLDTWLADTRDAPIPLRALGSNARELRARLLASHHVLDNDDAGGVTWTELGIGRTGGQTRMSAAFEHGVVAQLWVSLRSDPTTLEMVRARLTELRGAPKDTLADPTHHATVWTNVNYDTRPDGTAELVMPGT